MRKLILILIFCCVSIASLVSQIPQKPNPPRLVNNFLSESILSTQEEQQLETKLQTFSKETSNQICVVLVSDFNGYEPMELATQIGNEWGVGQSDFKNGIIILINPNRRKLAIAVGYGLEGAIPDLATKHIREELMQPNFKNGSYYQGLNKGIDELIGLAKGEIDVKRYKSEKNSNSWGTIILIIVILIIVFLSSNGGGGATYSRGGRGIWFGSFGGFGGGGFGGGSSGGGGGFGGFGGGSFGGGGSSGSW